MSDPTRPDIDAIRQRAEAATPGPWAWHGNADHPSLRLTGRDPEWGSTTVMTFRRWGMQAAQPVFWARNEDGHKVLRPGKQSLVYEVCPEALSRDDPRVYRGHIIDVRHPDAAFIAAARQDVEDLLAYIAALEQRP